MDRVACLGVVDLQARSRRTGLVASAAQKPPVEAPAYPSHGAAILARHGAAAHPVRCVPKRYQRVATTNCQIAAGRGQGKRKAGGTVSIEYVARFERRVGKDFDGSFASCYKKVEFVV